MARGQLVHMGRRRLLQSSLTLAGLGLLTGCGALPAPGQQPPQVPRIGYLTGATTAAAEFEAFRAGLRELGYVEGQNIVIEVRRSESTEHSQALVAEFVALPVDLILTPAGGIDTEAAMRATSTIPIVFAAAPDPVRNGYVASLPRPGGNVTGVSGLSPQLHGKGLQLLRELIPGVSRVMFLAPTAGAAANGALQAAEQSAQALGMQLLTPTIGTVGDLPEALRLAIAERAEALWAGASPQMNGAVGQIMAFATAER
jgi:putative ABC transport system substrate-binding protein